MPIAALVAIIGSARWTAGWRTKSCTGAKRPPRPEAGRRFGVVSTGMRVWVSAMGYTGMFMMSR